MDYCLGKIHFLHKHTSRCFSNSLLEFLWHNLTTSPTADITSSSNAIVSVHVKIIMGGFVQQRVYYILVSRKKLSQILLQRDGINYN